MIRQILWIALGLLLTLTPVNAQPPLARHVPADAMAYFGWAGRNLAFDGSQAGQMLNDPAIVDITTQMTDTIIELISTDQPEARPAVEGVAGMLSVLWQHRLAVAVMPAQAPGPVPVEVLLLADLGQDRPAFEQHVDQLLTNLAEQAEVEELPLESVVQGGVTFLQMPTGPAVLSWGYQESLLIVTLGPAEMPGRVLEATQSLLQSEAFAETYQPLAGENEQMVCYADIAGLMDLLSGLVPPDQPEAVQMSQSMQLLGLRELGGYVGVTRVVDRGFLSAGRFSGEMSSALLPDSLGSGSVDLSRLVFAPADTLYLTVQCIDAAASLQNVRALLEQLDPAMAEDFEAGLAEMEDQLNLSLEQDLLAHLGDQITLVSAPSLGGLLTGTACVIELDDAERFGQSLAKIESVFDAMSQPAPRRDGEEPWEYRQRVNSQPRLMRSTIGGLDVRYVLLPEESPISPAWTIADGRLIIAAWPQVVRAVVRGPQNGLLTDRPEFQQTLGRFGGEPISVTWLDTPAIAEQVYPIALMLWQFGARGMTEQSMTTPPVDLLPSLPLLTQYLRPGMTVFSYDGAGLLHQSYGSLPTLPFMGETGPAVVIGPAIFLPSLIQARQQARFAMSQANLRSIGNGIALYTTENDLLMPDSLEVLVEQGFVDPESLRSPLSNMPDQPSYKYFPIEIETMEQPSRTVLAYEDPATHGLDETPVLYGDCHVERVPVDQELYDAIERSRQIVQQQQ